jgi:hypothetical protein
MAYVLPNRKAFADFIARQYRNEKDMYRDEEDSSIDRCINPTNSNSVELLPYQKIVRDYLKIETPYRGILLYHGLGSGKTATAISVAESLLTDLKVYILLPKSLKANFISEIYKFGGPIYNNSQHWVRRSLNDETRDEALKLGISPSFLEEHTEFYTSVPNLQPNYNTFSIEAKRKIDAQIQDVLTSRFEFIHYNGLTQEKAAEIEARGFEKSVVIIDEAHNLISTVAKIGEGNTGIRKTIYNAIYNAKQCKVVALSGTPIINRPIEIAYMMNLLRGPIEQINVPFKHVIKWDEAAMTNALKAIPDIDTIEFNAVKQILTVTRNPPYFRSIYGTQGDRIAVQYKKEMKYIPLAADWVESWKTKFETDIGGGELAVERVESKISECLPTNPEKFASFFLDGLNIKNPMLFQRRIQGLVSYYKGADERLIPQRINDDKMLELCPMSKEQFTLYLQARWIEMKAASNRSRKSVDDEGGNYLVATRLICDYAIPPNLRSGIEISTDFTEDNPPEKEDILNEMRKNPGKYLSPKGLEIYSPKIKKLLENIKERKTKKQFIYSQYTSLEGLGVISAVLDANGWQKYSVVKNQAGQYIQDPTLDPDKFYYTFYVGNSDPTQDFRRQIFNNKEESSMPPSLWNSVKDNRLNIMLGSVAAAEGITLVGVRSVHILEPFWNDARHAQVIGRAIRICSHAKLPEPDRTVEIKIYLSTFTDEQKTEIKDYPNIVPIRSTDTGKILFLGDEPIQRFMTADETLYEIAYEKGLISKKITTLLKQSAIDCEVHRKFHSSERPVISCMRFDSNVKSESLAYLPEIDKGDTDKYYLRNTTRKKRRLQKVSIKGLIFLVDPDTDEVFDISAFEDSNRLLYLGTKKLSKIEFFHNQ